MNSMMGGPTEQTNNQIFIDQRGIIRHELHGVQSPATMIDMRERTLPLVARLRAEGKRVLILIDLSDIRTSDSSLRNESKKILEADFDRMAIVGNAYLQPLITFVLKTMGKSDRIRYCRSEKDALAWLMGTGALGGEDKTTNTSWAAWMIIPIFLLTIIGTIVAWRQATLRLESDATAIFNEQADKTVGSIDDRITAYTDAMISFRGLFHASQSVDEKEFHAFFDAVNLKRHYPGFNSIVYVSRVTNSERQQFINQIRNDTSFAAGGHPTFTITPDGLRNEYFVTTYVGSAQNNTTTSGIDLKTNDNRRPTLEKARDTGEPAATKTVQLLNTQGQETKDNPTGFLLTLPVYIDRVPTLLDDRREQHQGYINAVLEYRTLFSTTLTRIPKTVHVELKDANDKTVYAQGSARGELRTKTLPVTIADQTFSVLVSAPVAFGVSRSESALPRIVLSSGIVVSLLLVALFWMQNRARGRAVVLASVMTEDLQSERNEAVATKNKDEAILTSIGDGVFALDNAGRIVLFNKAAERISGFTAAEALGRPYAEVLQFRDETGKEMSDSFIKEAQAGKQASMKRHTVLIRKDGELLPVADSAAPIFDAAGQQHGIIIVFRDVAEQEKFERKLEQSNERYSLVSRATSDVVYDLDIATGSVLWNEALGTQYGYELPQSKSSLEWWTNHVHPDDAAAFNESNGKSMQGIGKTRTVEYRFQRADGSYIFVRDRAFVQHNKQGQPVRIIGSMLDITKQKQLDQAKDEFISLVSHQLRTPLTAIRLFTEMLAEGQVGDLNDGQKSYVDKVKISAERMIRLVGDILNISRIELGRVKIEPKPTDANKLITSLVEETRPIADEKQVSLSFTPVELPDIQLDPTIFEQVVHNLLTNAIRYTDTGKGHIEVHFTKEDNGYVLSVKDNGIGIPEKDKSRIFNRFFRADNAVSAVGEGTGLGLYLVKIIMESAGGRVWFDSAQGQGTTFYVTIPLTGMKPKDGEKSLG